jgi:N-acetyl-anhydromuramyl-L-alanine amidase AmpD
MQYDFTEEQYKSLVRLGAALCSVFPKIRPDAPRDAAGRIRSAALSAAEIDAFGGLIGHYHLTTAKTDPGPAFDWERVLGAVRSLLPGDRLKAETRTAASP